jgi:hypothetical protein
MKGKKSLALTNKSVTCLKDQKGIPIGTIMSISLAHHVSTPKLKNHTRNLSGLPIVLICMKLWIPLMAMLRFLKLPYEYAIWNIKQCPPTSHI